MLEDRDYMKPEPRGRGIGSLGSWTPVKTLFVANIAIFVIQHLVVSRGSAPFWLSEQFPAGGVSWDALREGRVWTLFTYMFVHSGFESNGLAFLHLLGNLLIIYVAGRPLQELLSQTKFYLLYFGGGDCRCAARDRGQLERGLPDRCVGRGAGVADRVRRQ